jgi:membrane protein DedA with SNARE-associated domain
METIIALLKNYGYWIVFLGSLVEGESIILPASALASQGYLNVYKIGFIAFFTTLFVDQLLFVVGHKYGDKIFKKFPSLQKPADKAFYFLHKYNKLFILSFRFIYGIRTLSPVVIGAAKVPYSVYVPLNFIAAIIWTVVSVGGGYLLGDLMMDMMHKFQVGQKYFFGGIFIIGLLFIVAPYVKKRLSKKSDHR